MQRKPTHLLAVTIASLTFLSCMAGATAQETPDPGVKQAVAADDLVAMALAAKDQFQPLPTNRVPEARAGLEKAISQLDTFLATGSEANAANWKQYLRWDEMTAELAKPEGPNLGRLGQILALYYRSYESLEHPDFAEMRRALLDYRSGLAMANDQQLAERYVTRLDNLAKQLAEFEQAPTMERSQAIGALVGWLETAGQADDLIAAIRERYWQPNLYTVVSQRLMNSGLTMEIAETEDVRDCILGTTMVGTASMQGSTKVELLDDTERAHILLNLTGNIHSDNVGYNRGVKIYTEGETQVHGTKSVHIDANGISSTDSQVSCSTDSKINAITAKSCLVEKIAWKRAGRSKSSAERVGSQHAEQRVAEGMDERADELLLQASNDYQEKFRKPLLRRDEFPQEMNFRTANGLLEIVWRQANVGQLAAPSKPTPIEGDNDLAVQLHESFVSNFSRAMLGGVRLTDKRLVELLEKNTGEVPEAVQLSDDKEPWAITFSSREPVSATFTENTLRFAIRGRLFELGERVVRKELEMSAVYKLEKTPEGAHLTRQGDVSVEYLGATGQLPAEAIIVRTVMRQKFEGIFAAEFETTGIQLPGRWENGGMLHLEQMVANNGWLNLAWTQEANAPQQDDDAAIAKN